MLFIRVQKPHEVIKFHLLYRSPLKDRWFEFFRNASIYTLCSLSRIWIRFTSF